MRRNNGFGAGKELLLWLVRATALLAILTFFRGGYTARVIASLAFFRSFRATLAWGAFLFGRRIRGTERSVTKRQNDR